ncbi:MAG: methylmalonyl-CoA mutase family protein, partial [Vulcanimicrobiaceae bacterium]
AKVALRTQHIIAYESGAAEVVDPLAGSYYVESLTNELIERAGELIAEIDDLGGSVAAIESGWMQARIAESAYRAQQAIERGESVVVGVNRFVEPGGTRDTIPLLRIDESIEREQVARLHALRTARDNALVATRLDEIRDAARGTANLMPRFIEAVDAGATLGEICGTLRGVFGVYQAKEALA